MKSKSLTLMSLSILALVMFMSLASAAVTLTEISVPSTADHNSQVTVTFDLTADQNYTTLDWSNSVDPSKGSWTTLPTTTSINNGQTLTLTAVFTIDEYASGNIADAQIVVDDTTTSHTDSLVFSSLTINEDKSLSVSDATIPEGEDSINITITNDGNKDLTTIELTASGDFDVSFSDNNFNLAKGIDKEITVTITSDLNDLELGSNSVTITATANDDTSATGTITTEKSFCDCENPGKLDIKIDDVNVEKGFGDEDDYWYLMDEIEIKLDVEVDGDWDIKDIEIEWELYLTNGEKIMDGDESDFNLDYDEEETITISFKLDEDLDEFEGEDVIFYIKATGEIDDNDADDYDGEETCDWTSKEIEMITDDDFVILDDFEFLDTVSCGTEVQISADVWNIGDSKQKDVYVMISNTELGIDQKITIGDIKAFDNEKLNAVLNIPQNAKEKSYPIKIEVYDEDNDVYKNENDREAEFFIHLKVEGSCEIEQKATVSAVLESGGKAGQEMVIKATITNTGDEIATFSLNAAAYAEWASSSEFDQTTIIVSAGESKDVLITFNVNKDVSGDKFFDIEVLSGNELIVKQPVQVSITKSGFSLTGNMISEGNWYLWGIGALNIILVIIIILVAIRVAKK